jgi:hypothetical protein
MKQSHLLLLPHKHIISLKVESLESLELIFVNKMHLVMTYYLYYT